MKKELWPVLIIHALIVMSFTVFYLARGNYEFMIYIGVIIGLTLLIFFSYKKINYSAGLLWALMIWSLLHLSGGSVMIGDGTLYQMMVVQLSDVYPILRFDQLVHAYGFGVAAFLTYALLKPFTKTKAKDSVAISIVIVMGAIGFGALNEIIEFSATVVTPKTGVGDYVNNALDQVFNLIGALIALFIIRFREKRA